MESAKIIELKRRFPKSVKANSPTLGEVEFKYISWRSFEFFSELFKKAITGKEFLIKVLHHQLEVPKISLEDFRKLPVDELIALGKHFAEHEEHIRQYFKETSQEQFYAHFRKAIETYFQNQLKKIQSAVRRIIEPYIEELYVDNSAAIENSIKIISQQLKGIQSSLEPIVEHVKQQVEFWYEWIEQNRETYVRYISFWQRFQEQYNESIKQEAAIVLKKYKWLISPSMPLSFVYKVAAIGTKKGNQRAKVNKLFVDYFSSNNFKQLSHLVNAWATNKMFKSRMKILRDCVSVMKNANHRYNPSNVVIPVLIAQIDGIRIKFMEQHGLSFRTKDKEWKKLFRDQTLSDALLEAANDVFLDILFQSSFPGKPLNTPFIFNRHKVMHGEFLTYGRIDNTIRAFLILDFLATVTNQKIKQV